MKKFFTVICLIAFCFIAVISMTNSAAAAGSNYFAKHSMAARQRQAAQRDLVVISVNMPWKSRREIGRKDVIRWLSFLLIIRIKNFMANRR